MTANPTPTLAMDDPVLRDFATEVGDTGPVAVAGARTRWSAGGDLHSDARVIDAPGGIAEYRPEEMTVRVRAGTPVAELHAALAEAGQRTALPERGGTVGGALAVGESDFRALGRGLVRASVLQVRYVSAEGRLINSGGPTVKNVSGFDLPRLMVGSLGTLGLLAEVILRTNPIPAVDRWTPSWPPALFCGMAAPSSSSSKVTHPMSRGRPPRWPSSASHASSTGRQTFRRPDGRCHRSKLATSGPTLHTRPDASSLRSDSVWCSPSTTSPCATSPPAHDSSPSASRRTSIPPVA